MDGMSFQALRLEPRMKGRRPFPRSRDTRSSHRGTTGSPRRGRGARLTTLLTSLILTAELKAQPATATAPVGVVRFQPGVHIDWSGRRVLVDGRIVLRHGPLEFFACFAGKEHESIVRLEAAAVHVYMALGLIGLAPGRPPTWDEAGGRFLPAEGDLVEVRVEWEEGGARRSARPCDWLTEIEYARRPRDVPWVFAGSIRRADERLAADLSGAGIALVDFPDSLLSLTRGLSSRNELLWAVAEPAAIPELQTGVRVVLCAATPREHVVRIDFRGEALVDGALAGVDELIDLVSIARRLNPGYVQTIELERALESDVQRWNELFLRAELPGGAVRYERSVSEPRP